MTLAFAAGGASCEAGGLMKRTLFAFIIAMLALAAPASAQHGGGSAKPPKPVQTPKVQTPKVQTTKTQAPKPVKVQSAPKSTTAGPKVQKVKVTGTPKAPTKTTAKTTSKPTTAKSSKPASSTISTTSTTGTTPLTPVQQKLLKNTNLAAKLQSRLPAGTNLQLAAGGFRNLGQFVAAVNVSRNLGIPFAELKTRMVDRGMSLGQAIQDARPTTTNTTTVVARAETDADDLIRETEGTKATKTNTKTAKTKPPKVTKTGTTSTAGGLR
jgi:hypothetical protein